MAAKTTKQPKRGGTTSAPAPRLTAPTPKTLEEKQAALNRLVWAHGSNVRSWADWPKLLMEQGMTPADVTDSMFHRAENWCRKELSRRATEANGAGKRPRMVIVGDSETDTAMHDRPAPTVEPAPQTPPRKKWGQADTVSLREQFWKVLCDDPKTTSEIVAECGLPSDWVSVHLVCCIKQGLVAKTSDGRYCRPQ